MPAMETGPLSTTAAQARRSRARAERPSLPRPAPVVAERAVTDLYEGLAMALARTAGGMGAVVAPVLSLHHR
jgi:hypothetical protein